MTPRIASSVLVGALLRKAETQGGFGAVVARGDATAGSVLVILLERGRRAAVVERVLRPDGNYAWQEVGNQGGGNEEELEKFLHRRRRFDPDMWILELDIASSERFVAEMNDLD